eukprot:TCONS_00060573-protein
MRTSRIKMKKKSIFGMLMVTVVLISQASGQENPKEESTQKELEEGGGGGRGGGNDGSSQVGDGKTKGANVEGESGSSGAGKNESSRSNQHSPGGKDPKALLAKVKQEDLVEIRSILGLKDDASIIDIVAAMAMTNDPKRAMEISKILAQYMPGPNGPDGPVMPIDKIKEELGQLDKEWIQFLSRSILEMGSVTVDRIKELLNRDAIMVEDISMFLMMKKIVENLSEGSKAKLVQMSKLCQGGNTSDLSLFKRWSELKESKQEKIMDYLKKFQPMKKEQIEKIITSLANSQKLEDLAKLLNVSSNVRAILAKIVDDESASSPELMENVTTFLRQNTPVDSEMIREMVEKMSGKEFALLAMMVGVRESKNETLIVEKLLSGKYEKAIQYVKAKINVGGYDDGDDDGDNSHGGWCPETGELLTVQEIKEKLKDLDADWVTILGKNNLDLPGNIITVGTIEKTLTANDGRKRIKEISLFFRMKELVDDENMAKLVEMLKPCEGAKADIKSVFRKWGESKESIQVKAFEFVKNLQPLGIDEIKKIVNALANSQKLEELAKLVGVNSNVNTIIAEITKGEMSEEIEEFLKDNKPIIDIEILKTIIERMQNGDLLRLVEMVGTPANADKESKDYSKIIQKISELKGQKKADVFSFLKRHMSCEPDGPGSPNGPGGPNGPDGPNGPVGPYSSVLFMIDERKDALGTILKKGLAKYIEKRERINVFDRIRKVEMKMKLVNEDEFRTNVKCINRRPASPFDCNLFLGPYPVGECLVKRINFKLLVFLSNEKIGEKILPLNITLGHVKMDLGSPSNETSRRFYVKERQLLRVTTKPGTEDDKHGPVSYNDLKLDREIKPVPACNLPDDFKMAYRGLCVQSQINIECLNASDFSKVWLLSSNQKQKLACDDKRRAVPLMSDHSIQYVPSFDNKDAILKVFYGCSQNVMSLTPPDDKDKQSGKKNDQSQGTGKEGDQTQEPGKESGQSQEPGKESGQSQEPGKEGGQSQIPGPGSAVGIPLPGPLPAIFDLREGKSFFSKGLEVIFEVEKAPPRVEFNVKPNIGEVFSRNIPYQQKEGNRRYQPTLLTIEEIMDGPFSYERGKGKSLVVHTENGKGGLVLWQTVQTDPTLIQKKCTGDPDFKTFKMPILLKRDCQIKFENRAEKILRYSINVYAWDGKKELGKALINLALIESGTAFSIRTMKLTFKQINCEGKVDKLCKPKCDGQLVSTAVKQCGECIRGNTNRTQSDHYKCGICLNDLLIIINKYKETPRKYKKDCNGTCAGSADNSECGVCLRKGDIEARAALKDECGQCKNNPNKKICEPGSLAIKAYAPKAYDEYLTFPINICLNEQHQGVKTCALHGKQLQVVCPLTVANKIKHPTKCLVSSLRKGCRPRILPFKREKGKTCFTAHLLGACPSGQYELKCKSDNTEIVPQPFTIRHFPKTEIESIKPQTYKHGPNFFELSVKGLHAGKLYSCCYQPCPLEKQHQCCSKAVLPSTDGSKMKCPFRNIPSKVKGPLQLYVRGCACRKSEPTELTFDCVDPIYMKHRIIRRRARGTAIGFYYILRVHFNGTISQREGCDKKVFIKTRRRGELDVILTPQDMNQKKISIPNTCLKCSTANGSLEIPMENDCPGKNNAMELSSCDAGIFPKLKQINSFRWELLGGNPGLTFEVSKWKKPYLPLRRKEFQDQGWADVAGKDYEFQFHYKNKLSRDCVSQYNVTVATDSSITCELKVRPESDYVWVILKKCGRFISRKEYSFSWNVTLNETAQEEASTSFRLNLKKFVRSERMVAKVHGVVYDSAGSEICKTKPLHRIIKGIQRELYINGGKEKICVPCDRVKPISLFGRYFETKNGEKKSIKLGKNPKGFEWSCQSGEAPCFPEDLEQITDQRKWIFNASALACERSYMVQLGYRGLDAVLQIDRASVCAPTIRACWPVPQRDKDPEELKFICRVKGMNLTIDDVDVAFAPLSDTTEKEYAPEFNISHINLDLKPMKKHPNLFDFVATVSRDVFTPFLCYRFEISVGDDSDVTTKNVELCRPGKPTNCTLDVSLADGAATAIAFNTSFDVSMTGCESQDKDIYCNVYMKNRDGKFMPLISASDNCDLMRIKSLPPGKEENNMKQKLKACAFISDNKIEACLEYEIVVERGKNTTVSEAVMTAIDNLSEADGEQDAITQTIATSLEQLTELADSNEGGSAEEEVFAQKAATALVDLEPDDSVRKLFVDVVDSEATEAIGETVKGLAITFAAQTNPKKIEPLDSEVADAGSDGSDTGSDGDSGKRRRRRRSLDGNEDEENDIFEDRLLDSVELTSEINVLESAIFPISYDNIDYESKTTFLGKLPTYKRSIVQNKEEEVDSTNRKFKLLYTLYETVPTNMNLHQANGLSISFDNATKDKYDSWTCSEDGNICQGFYLSISYIFGDIWSDNTIEDKDLVTPVTSASFVNPSDSTDSNYQLVEDSDVTIPMTFNYEGNQTDLPMLMCHQWDSTSFTTVGCQTTTNNETVPYTVNCHCSSNLDKHIAVFLVSFDALVDIAEEEEEAAERLATTTTTTTTATSAPETTEASQGNWNGTERNLNNVDGGSDGNNVTDGNGNGGAGNNGTDGNGNGVDGNDSDGNGANEEKGAQEPKKSTFKFSMNHNYNTFIAKYVNQAAAETDVCNSVKAIHANLVNITNCKISAGSIVVQFDLTAQQTVLDETSTVLKNTFKEDYELSTSQGNLPVTSTSLYQDGDYKGPAKPTEDDDDGDKTVLIIIVVVVVLVVVIAVAVIIFMVHKKNQRNVRNKKPPTTATEPHPITVSTAFKVKVDPNDGYSKMRQSPNQ